MRCSRGSRLGYLPHYEKVAAKAYEYIVDNFVVNNHNGTLGYNGTVAVCSLNSTASYEVSVGLMSLLASHSEALSLTSGPNQYYIGQPILYNSVLGSGSFILASLEYERYRKSCA